MPLRQTISFTRVAAVRSREGDPTFDLLGRDLGEQLTTELRKQVRLERHPVATNGRGLAPAVVLDVTQPLRRCDLEARRCPGHRPHRADADLLERRLQPPLRAREVRYTRWEPITDKEENNDD